LVAEIKVKKNTRQLPKVITNWTFEKEPSPEFKRVMALLLKREGNGQGNS